MYVDKLVAVYNIFKLIRKIKLEGQLIEKHAEKNNARRSKASFD